MARMVYCLSCGKLIEEWDGGYYARNMLCVPCYQAKMAETVKRQCFSCARRVRPEEGGELVGRFYCSSCLASERERIAKITCESCKKVLQPWEKRFPTPDGKVLCEKCYTSGMGRLGARACYKCGRVTRVKFISDDKRSFCARCSAQVEKMTEHDRPIIERLRVLVKKAVEGDE